MRCATGEQAIRAASRSQCRHAAGRSLVTVTGIALALLAGTAPAQPPPATVRVDEVRVEPLVQTVPVLGHLVARQAGAVAARIEGPVEQLLVEVGDRVAKGQVLAVLNADVLAVERELAAAKLAEAQANLQIRQAELGLAEQEVKRLERLKDSAATSRAAYDDARQSRVIAAAKVDAGRAGVVSASAGLKRAELDLRYAEVRAPYDGVVVERSTEIGTYLKAGDDVVTLVADEALEVEADVPSERLIGLRPGTELRMELDDGTTHRAVVRAVVPQESNLTRTRQVRFAPRFSDTLGPLAVNQNTTLYVPVAAPRDVLSVHKDAVIKRGERSIVFVVVEDVAELRPVRLGEAVGNRFEVLDGLQAGDLTVVRGNERLQPNQKVTRAGAPS